ncbi:hypothetical protein SKAU_G00095510 [Synaphobranchus kaupii]|uniref:Uncharacterized protein n=1 Tax=Synaphobranchus kaupii TaxID=118154 RepID=A0A9Q1FYD7_SYNKA|nr:hypothetical protein SKAU_G00095510 [Synaphobranchus kaupii]
MGPVTYEVHHPDKGKKKQTYYVNLLREWKEREPTVKKALMVQKVEEDEEMEGDLESWQQKTHPRRTRVMEHHIYLKASSSYPSAAILGARTPGGRAVVQ